MNCPICKDKTKLFCVVKNYEIYKCIRCGFGFTKNLSAQKGSYHRDDDYIEEEALFRNIFQKRVNKITKFIKAGRVLEVGCSTGLMLSLFAQRGFEVQGVEISKKAAEKARSRGIEVYTDAFEKIKFSEKFDVVVFNHTLEHLSDPVGVLKKVKLILKPKGFLYIDLPNFDSYSAKVMKGKWPMLLPDEHLWHFTPKAFMKLFKDMDFKMVDIERASGIWDFDNPFLELLIALKGFKKRFFKEIVLALPALVFSKTNSGSDLMVIARKR